MIVSTIAKSKWYGEFWQVLIEYEYFVILYTLGATTQTNCGKILFVNCESIFNRNMYTCQIEWCKHHY